MKMNETNYQYGSNSYFQLLPILAVLDLLLEDCWQ